MRFRACERPVEVGNVGDGPPGKSEVGQDVVTPVVRVNVVPALFRLGLRLGSDKIRFGYRETLFPNVFSNRDFVRGCHLTYFQPIGYHRDNLDGTPCRFKPT